MTTPDELLSELERARLLIEGMPPFPLRIEMPSEVWETLRRQVPDVVTSLIPHVGALPVEIDDTLPARSFRVHMSDGSSRVESL